MKPRQIIVNLIIIAVLAGIAVFCFYRGKAYDLLIDNVAYTNEGVTYQAFEAVQVTLDNSGSKIFLLEGDRGAAKIAGHSHVIIIEELDEDDNVFKTHKIHFKSKELDGNVINLVPMVLGKLPGWNYPMKK